jgi:hypothetical protein
MTEHCEAMKRGGRKRKGKKSSKATQQQIVNVKVKVGDTVQLLKGNPTPHHVGMGDFRLLQGVGRKYANPPIVQQPSSYGIYPASKAPMYDDSIRVGGGSQYNANRVDDIANSVFVNPYGIVPDNTPSKRAIPGKDMFADRRVNYDITSQLPMQSEAPALHQVPVQKQSMRATPSQPSAGYMAMRYPAMKRIDDALEQLQRGMSSASASSSALDGEDPEEYMRQYQEQGEHTKAPGLTAQQRHLEEAKFMEMHANMRRGGSVF